MLGGLRRFPKADALRSATFSCHRRQDPERVALAVLDARTSSSTTNYIYDGANILEEVDSSGNVLAKYTQGAGVDEPLAMLRSGTSYFYEQDGLGSVTSLTDTSGSTIESYGYGAYGGTFPSTYHVPSPNNPYRFTGRELDATTGLYYYRARYYDPSVDRFLSEDPLGFSSGITNFYDYVGNNPVRRRDPSGKCIIELWIEPTGEDNNGFFRHAFITLFDNSRKTPGNPTRVFRGGPGPGNLPLLDVGYGPLGPGSDQPSDAIYYAPLLSNGCSCQQYLNQLFDLEVSILNAKIRYSGTQNSNTVASEGIRALGLSVPTIPARIRSRLPGWGNSLGK